MEFCAATGNAGKLKEIRRILERQGHTVKSQKELGITLDPEENGTTFAENALIKAKAICEVCGMPTIADDSGLAVDALDGAPGVYSARYAGAHGDDAANNALLLKNLEGVKDRRAAFVCTFACAFPDAREPIVAQGRVEGEILEAPRGTGGFGYDCLFESDDLKKSFGEATAEEKNAVSHRFRGLQKLREQIKK